MKLNQCKVGTIVCHLINPTKSGMITGILRPDDPSVRVVWESLDVKWHSPSELRPAFPEDKTIGFQSK